MTDSYDSVALPHEVAQAVRRAERQLETRLTEAGLSYEVSDAALAFQRALSPVLLALATVTDPEGAPAEDWLATYAATRAELEGDVIFNGVTERQRQAVAFATSHLKDARAAFHYQERMRERARQQN
jgi:hypothetical protein